jgi:hypothetical protein
MGGFVDATRFPVQIKVLKQEPREAEKREVEKREQARAASVAILSSASFDATKDIQRATLNFAGVPVRREPEPKGGDHTQCTSATSTMTSVPIWFASSDRRLRQLAVPSAGGTQDSGDDALWLDH